MKKFKRILISFSLGILLVITPMAAFPKTTGAIMKNFTKTIKSQSACPWAIDGTLYTSDGGQHDVTCFNTWQSIVPIGGYYYCSYSCVVWN